ncbi:type III pantothenate kinase, partial [Candidatus Pelagibacter sp.]|nr:type III pantothenate kinase [Candidatus Pelagibacter sp.]
MNCLLRYISIKFALKKNNIKKILFCSVVPKSFRLIKSYFKNNLKLRPLELKELKIKSLIDIKVNYNQIGSDRLANSISAMNGKDNYIILDFGTATTFDVLIKNTYHGGVIAPGIKLSLGTLINKATLIPKLKLKSIDKVIGLNTVNAVRAGFFWGYRGLIDNIVHLIKKETGKNFKIISTGGFSYLFKK